MGTIFVNGLTTSLLNRVPCVPACQRGLRANVPTCQRTKSVPTSHVLRANMPVNVTSCHTASQYFNLACQLTKRRADFSNIPLRNAKGNFYTLLLYKKFYIILDIIVIQIICIFIVDKNYI